ncbi:MAG: ATP-binding protein, partial [Trueperaceae bacterium]|nr:ATP-binding protein [Trueperaceae bacterium]
GEAWRAAADAIVAAGLARLRAEADARRERAARTRLFEAWLHAQEEERARVARDLNDEIGQTLTALVLHLDGDDGAADAKALAARALADVRRVAVALRPSVLDDLGLEAALRRTARDLAARHALRVQVTVALPRLPRRQETVLYRVGQEALTNVVRHADAGCASVVATAAPDRIDLVVEDDGVGFDVADVAPADRVGLAGMRERVEAAGGRLRIESRPGAGATVYARLPRTH